MPTHDASYAKVPLDVGRLEQENRALRERIAFYEGFDGLIQDNVGQARELLRIAAQEREAAAAESARVRGEAAARQTMIAEELRAIGRDVEVLANAIEALRRRITSAIGAAEEERDLPPAVGLQSVTVVVHGVSSAARAQSLRAFTELLPQVAEVSARELAGGVLRLETRVRAPLLVDHFGAWVDSSEIVPLTERPEIVEFAFAHQSG